MSTRPKPVNQKYFGQPIGNGQDPDDPWDSSHGTGPLDEKIGGKGAQGGGSKPTPQAHRPRSQAISGSSKPKTSQRIRG